MVAASALTSGHAAPATTSGGTPTSGGSLHCIPAQREVARPVQNLGNTCYINAVLQALAHAPELCLAMDCDPHHPTCPIFQENNRKRQSSPSMSPEGDAEQEYRRNKPAARPKLRRSSRKSPTSGLSINNSSSNGAASGGHGKNYSNESSHNNNSNTDDDKYCALCEMEHHLEEVHNMDPTTKEKDKAVAPHSFVSGFIEHVAPWFKVGQQEDSHEFLRLLIDAMQRSCKNARPKLEDDPMDEDIPPLPDDTESAAAKAAEESKDVEYPFQLFRGTVESCVTCDSCKASSSTFDPIEDVGLEVTPHTPSSASGVSTRGSVSSPSNSNFEALADVSSAFQRFARIENLDAGYKCEKCGKGGRATKQSRLASIPPILTLHLKRFRYGGDARGPSPAFASGNRRTKSGSSKIEGHIKFEVVFDLRPYLTDELQAKHKKMFCRLFAVIVHAGKNSHSGHYVAFVRNIVKNEWWKMDDSRITVASQEEVMQAEAYMLFYRVLDHPVAVQLEDRAKKMRNEYEEREAMQKLLAEESKKEEMAAADAAEIEKENLPVVEMKNEADTPMVAKEDPAPAPKVKTPENSEKKQLSSSPGATPSKVSASATTATSPKPAATTASSSGASSSRKRGIPEYTDGRSWARANTRLKTYTSIHSAEDYINENVQFTAEYFKRINEEGNKPNARVDHCPIKQVTREDVAGGFGRWQKGLKQCIYRFAKRYEEENVDGFFAVPIASNSESQASTTANPNLADKIVAVGNATGDDSLL